MFMIPVSFDSVSLQIGYWWGQEGVVSLASVVIAGFVGVRLVRVLRHFVFKV